MSLDDLRNRVLERVPLDALISEKLILKDRSGQKIGPCPFHDEKTPSFYVYTDFPQRYHCYGCSVHGNAIDWVRYHLGLEYVESLRHLAAKYAIEAPELDEGKGERQRLGSLFTMMRDAQRYFSENLLSLRGTGAREYLADRGFGADAQQNFGFGLASDSPYALLQTLKSKGYSEEQMLACSLIKASERSGRPFDFFRNRITVPIHDREGRVIAFGGRASGNEQPKYLNPSTTTIFDKSHTLFGLHTAREAMRHKGRALVVEGYMDVLQLWNHGFTEAVACMGTALTEGQLKMLQPFTRNVYLIFDSDRAGRSANLKAVKHVISLPHLSVKVVLLPDDVKDDPDSFLKNQGPEALEALIASAQDILHYAIGIRLDAASGLEVADIIQQEFAPWLASVDDPIQRALLTNLVAQRSGVTEALVYSAVQTAITGTLAKGSGTKLGSKLERQDGRKPASIARSLTPLEYDILGHMFYADPTDLDLQKIRSFLRQRVEWDEIWGELSEEFLGKLEQTLLPRTTVLAEFASAVDHRVMSFLRDIQAKGEAFAGSGRAALVEKLMRTHEARHLRSQVSQLKTELARAGDDVIKVLSEIQRITKEINQLEK